MKARRSSPIAARAWSFILSPAGLTSRRWFWDTPCPRALFQPDLYTPGTGAGGPAAEHLLKSIQALNLKVDLMVGGHGGAGPFADLGKAVAPKPASN